MTLQPQIDRFAAESGDEFSTEQAAFIIGCHVQTVLQLCWTKKLEHSAVQGRGEGRTKYTITRAGLLAYLVRITQGPRDALLTAIEQQCPAWLVFAKNIAAGLPQAAAEESMRPGLHARRVRSSNVIDFEHPDLFSPQISPISQMNRSA